MSGSFLFFLFPAPIPSGRVSSTQELCCRRKTADFAPLCPKFTPEIDRVPIIPAAFRPTAACSRRPTADHPVSAPKTFPNASEKGATNPSQKTSAIIPATEFFRFFQHSRYALYPPPSAPSPPRLSVTSRKPVSCPDTPPARSQHP